MLLMTEKIKLTIDEVEVEVEKGVTVLQAAQSAGIYIPTLCYHPDLLPYGGCRLCIVEIENMRGFPTSCTTPATHGMVVRTSTSQLQKLRQDFLQLILTEHPNACITCDRRERCSPYDICLRNVAVTERCVVCPNNKQCELQDLIDYIGIGEMPLPYKYKDLPVDDSSPLIERNYNLCVLCGRCVQMCADVRGIGAISFVNRGFDVVVSTSYNRALQDSGCRFCGACVEVCPTGALMDKEAKYRPDCDHESVAVPCKYACPAGINVPLYVYLIGEGKYQEAFDLIDEITREKFPDVMHANFSELLRFSRFAVQGRKDQAIAALSDGVKHYCWVDPDLPWLMAGLYSAMKEKDEAFRWLKRAIDRGWINYPLFAEQDPLYENIRNDARFQKLMDRIRPEWERFEIGIDLSALPPANDD